MKILVAGASGLIGWETLGLLKTAGHHIRSLSRDPGRAARLSAVADEVRLADAKAPRSLEGVCDSIDVVVSALGAPVSPASFARNSYLETDLAANLALLSVARTAGVRRFVYVSVHIEPSYAETRYARAHTDFEDALRSSGLEYGIVRPTGVFGTFLQMLPMARLGVIPLIGDGRALSNPIHERDVAACIVDLALGPGTQAELDAGGPEVLTRRAIAELAFRAVLKKPRLPTSPPEIARFSAAMIGLVNPRSRDFIDFITLASTHDCVAPVRGQQRLGPYFEARSSRPGPGPIVT
jgi:uncharacterized protein YbjT (DUF2867 family)